MVALVLLGRVNRLTLADAQSVLGHWPLVHPLGIGVLGVLVNARLTGSKLDIEVDFPRTGTRCNSYRLGEIRAGPNYLPMQTVADGKISHVCYTPYSFPVIGMSYLYATRPPHASFVKNRWPRFGQCLSVVTDQNRICFILGNILNHYTRKLDL